MTAMMPMQASPPPMAQPGTDPTEQEQDNVSIDAVVSLLRDERMRNFRIDIETDQMVQPDEQAEKQAAVEMVTAIGQFLGTFGPMVKEMPPLAPMAGQLLLFALRRFKAGRDMEEIIEKTMGDVAQTLQNPAPPMPDPTEQAKTEREKIGAQVELAKGQQSMQQAAQAHQSDLEKAQIEHQAELAKMQHQAELEQAKAEAEHRRQMERHQAEMERLMAEEQRALAHHEREMQRAEQAHGQKLTLADESHRMSVEQVQAKKEAEKPAKRKLKVTRGADGKIEAVGTLKIVRGKDGRIEGVQED